MELVLVYGTSTEIGKTWVAQALAVSEAKVGRVQLWKPFETGDTPADLDSQSYTNFLHQKPIAKQVSIKSPLLSLQPAVSPHFALIDSIDQGQVQPPPAFTGDLAAWMQHLVLGALGEQQSSSNRALVIETAGGVQVEICPGWTNLDLGQLLVRESPGKVRVVLVGAGGLGTINHTLLSIDCLEQHGLAPNLVILNRHSQATPKESVMRNLKDIRRRRPGPRYCFLDYGSVDFEEVGAQDS